MIELIKYIIIIIIIYMGEYFSNHELSFFKKKLVRGVIMKSSMKWVFILTWKIHIQSYLLSIWKFRVKIFIMKLFFDSFTELFYPYLFLFLSFIISFSPLGQTFIQFWELRVNFVLELYMNIIQISSMMNLIVKEREYYINTIYLFSILFYIFSLTFENFFLSISLLIIFWWISLTELLEFQDFEMFQILFVGLNSCLDQCEPFYRVCWKSIVLNSVLNCCLSLFCFKRGIRK